MDEAPAASAPLAFSRFADAPDGPGARAATRADIAAHACIPEPLALAPLLAQARLLREAADAAHQLALRLAGGLRRHRRLEGGAGLAQEMLGEFALSSQEGVALMCLAEALLRIPDAATRDALIRDKIGRSRWDAHAGRSPSLFVNAASWGLLLTGALLSAQEHAGLQGALARLIGRGGEPLVRHGIDSAVRMLGEQFVAGRTIGQALARARAREARGYRHSYDMLGEAAWTAADAQRHWQDYAHAIEAVGAAAGAGVEMGADGEGGIDARPGVSIKLSALHPRYRRAQYARVMDELYPALRRLALLAREHGIGLSIDAEESQRLELSLDLLERLCGEPALAGWAGIGFVVQAYQKRSPFVVAHLIALARRSGHRLRVRLVKGAYWDSEIKRAQVDGLADYPVFTRKSHTDVAYLACARSLLAAPDAVYPQFATHNAQTLAAVYHLADPQRYMPGQYEFQCLYGMGESLYAQVVGPPAQGGLGRPCRIYAPVGTHETLLAYLVRRLLENGANTSFVHRVGDASVPLDALVQDPVHAVEEQARRDGMAVGQPHPAIVLPRALHGDAWRNSQGWDLDDEAVLEALGASLRVHGHLAFSAAPMLAIGGVEVAGDTGSLQAIRNPADRRQIVGHVRQAVPEDVDAALAHAAGAAGVWAAWSPAQRADTLDAAADALEANRERLMSLLIREAGKTCANAAAEVREAADFLRYDAAHVRALFDNATHKPLGPVLCISPWNFPLAIFVGQIAAALAAGNVVLAKPAAQTPLVAAEAVRLLWCAGVPRGALQLLPGPGETVGARLAADARVQGVLFTGSTEVARGLQRSLGERLGAQGGAVPLIAETGGQNAMIVDASALAEQVVADVLASAFDSAGQRCSALRVLCLQEDIAQRTLGMLRGAMAELALGVPERLATDVGPVIGAAAQRQLLRHIEAMRAAGRPVYQAPWDAQALRHGCFVAPTLIGLERLDQLPGEIFGPVLHWLCYPRDGLDALLAQIEATGYALTLGMHTRIDATVERVRARTRAGNVYVNRSMIGAAVGVQPFGGEGLSGTGPKAGGPLYLYRLLACCPEDAAVRAFDREGQPARQAEGAASRGAAPGLAALTVLAGWASETGRRRLVDACACLAAQSRSGAARLLCGPAGELNLYSLVPRRAVLCLADAQDDLLLQLAAVLAAGSRAIWPKQMAPRCAGLPALVRARIAWVQDWAAPPADFDVVLHHGGADQGLDVLRRIAALPGPVRSVHCLAPGQTQVPLMWLLAERSLSINTAAAGGNASLLAMMGG